MIADRTLHRLPRLLAAAGLARWPARRPTPAAAGTTGEGASRGAASASPAGATSPRARPR